VQEAQEALARAQEALARAQEARARERATCQALARQALARGPFHPRKGLVIQVRGKGLVIQVRAESTTIQSQAPVKEGVDNNRRPRAFVALHRPDIGFGSTSAHRRDRRCAAGFKDRRRQKIADGSGRGRSAIAAIGQQIL
jgi:hypothetical protein